MNSAFGSLILVVVIFSEKVDSQFVLRSSDLDCDFERVCRWRNGTNQKEDNSEWHHGSSVVLDSWHSVPRPKDGPGDVFAYVQGTLTRDAPDTALLVSGIVPCQRGVGELTFWYWKTSNLPVLEICTRQPPGNRGTIRCVDSVTGIHRQEWSVRMSMIPESLDPFEIVFRATFNYNFDILAIDEVSYSAEICGKSRGVEYSNSRYEVQFSQAHDSFAALDSSEDAPTKIPKDHSVVRREASYADQHLETAIRVRRHSPEVSFRRQKDAKSVDYSGDIGFRRRLPHIIADPLPPSVEVQAIPDQKIQKPRNRPMLIVARHIPGYVENEQQVDIVEIPTTASATFLSSSSTTPTSTTTSTTTTTPIPTPPSAPPIWRGNDPFALTIPLGGGTFPFRFDVLNFMRQLAPLVPQILTPKLREDSIIAEYDTESSDLLASPLHSAKALVLTEPEVYRPTGRTDYITKPDQHGANRQESGVHPAFNSERRKGYSDLSYRPLNPRFTLQAQNQFDGPGKGSNNVRKQNIGPPSFEPPQLGEAQGLCPAVDCDFDGSQLCQYKTGSGRTGLRLPPGTAERAWRVSDRQVANSLTGIFSDVSGSGMFAYAGLTDEKPDFFVMSSGQFTTPINSRLHFSFYLAGIEGRIRLCVNDLTNCPFESLGKDIKLDSRKWRKASVPLDAGTKSLHFVVDNLRKNYVVGIDEIELRDATGTRMIPCV